jgi:predicted house-cleaning noncanonical NTP pyrophosphatase (MazG superfamily)
MSETVHNKLVRDQILDIIQANGETPVIRVLDEPEFKQALLEKLIEEARELLADCSLAERADVEEVLRAIDETFGFSAADIEAVRQQKADERGAFTARIFLEKVIE